MGNREHIQTFAAKLCQQVSTSRFHLIKNSFSNMVSLQRFPIGTMSILTYRSRSPINLKLYSCKDGDKYYINIVQIRVV